MKNWKFKKYSIYILLGGLIFSMTSFCLAAEKDLMRTQGIINPGGNLKAGYLFINEMRVYIDRATRVMNHYGTPIPVTDLKTKKFVYLEMEKEPNQSIHRAIKIYLLPYYVNPGNKQKFPFMK